MVCRCHFRGDLLYGNRVLKPSSSIVFLYLVAPPPQIRCDDTACQLSAAGVATAAGKIDSVVRLQECTTRALPALKPFPSLPLSQCNRKNAC
jgi:hypothetical protein